VRLVTIVWIYAIGWFLYASYFAISMYMQGELKDVEASILKKVENDPEAIAHYENDVHGIRTKLHIILPALPILLAFMMGSVWPLAIALRVSVAITGFLRRKH
jgi:hypothetical protein